MRPGGFEPPTNSLEGCCSIHLSYGRPMVLQQLTAHCLIAAPRRAASARQRANGRRWADSRPRTSACATRCPNPLGLAPGAAVAPLPPSDSLVAAALAAHPRLAARRAAVE